MMEWLFCGWHRKGLWLEWHVWSHCKWVPTLLDLINHNSIYSALHCTDKAMIEPFISIVWFIIKMYTWPISFDHMLHLPWYSKTFTDLLWSNTTKQISLTTHVYLPLHLIEIYGLHTGIAYVISLGTTSMSIPFWGSLELTKYLDFAHHGLLDQCKIVSLWESLPPVSTYLPPLEFALS